MQNQLKISVTWRSLYEPTILIEQETLFEEVIKEKTEFQAVMVKTYREYEKEKKLVTVLTDEDKFLLQVKTMKHLAGVVSSVRSLCISHPKFAANHQNRCIVLK
ncbi:uncharacterized protein LOC143233963 [Tachypleus tridentatus]|uniref:uncharacterized protein LOC143233963 n=1 Tax=Tachypleus tridentatus TaxID=6853 RepID=UPI003FD302E3